MHELPTTDAPNTPAGTVTTVVTIAHGPFAGRVYEADSTGKLGRRRPDIEADRVRQLRETGRVISQPQQCPTCAKGFEGAPGECHECRTLRRSAAAITSEAHLEALLAGESSESKRSQIRERLRPMLGFELSTPRVEVIPPKQPCEVCGLVHIDLNHEAIDE